MIFMTKDFGFLSGVLQRILGLYYLYSGGYCVLGVKVWLCITEVWSCCEFILPLSVAHYLLS